MTQILTVSRRTAIAGVAASIAVGTLRAAPPTGGDWAIYQKLTSLFTALLSATNPIADGITRLKFSNFLYQVNETLVDLLAEKRKILSTLRVSACVAGEREPMMRRATQAAQEIGPLVDKLGRSVRTLASAIKLVGTQAQANAIADALIELRYSKGWSHFVPLFCDLPAPRRVGLIAEVKVSVAKLQDAQTRLTTLINKLDI